jgi:hypothetical protein
MYNRVDRYDPYVRAAIFYEYDGICFHDKKPLNFREMELDHIIPKKNCSKKAMRKNYTNFYQGSICLLIFIETVCAI